MAKKRKDGGRNADRRRRLDAALKAAFEAKAAEPVPEHLVELAEELDRPPSLPKAG